MSEWKEYKLTELGYLKRGKSKHRPRHASHLFGGKYPFIQTGEIKSAAKYVKKYDQTYSDAGLAQSKLWPKGTLCITIAANIAEIAVLEFDACFPDSVLGFIPNKSICDLDFIFYTLTYFKKELQARAIGSVQDNINAGTFENIKFPIPPLKQQQNIADILTSIDNKIDLLHRQNKTMQELASVLFKQWFVEDEAENWQETIFSDHTEVFRGLSYKGSGLAEFGNGIPMHNLNSVYEGGGYKYEGIKYYNGEYRDRHIIKPGELIVTNTEQGHDHKLIGCPGIVPRFFGDFGLFSQHIYKLSVKNETYLTPQFFYYLLLSPKVREQVTGATNGSTVNMLAIDGLQMTKFKLPPEGRVIQFSQLVKDFWQKKEKNYEQVQTLTKLRETLLPKLMSGEVKIRY
jgi:type I restriction enzyme S subunit